MRYCFSFFTLLVMISGLQAQSPVYKSPTELIADQLVARTQPDYYMKLQASLYAESLNPCASDLCKSVPLPVTLLSFSGERIDITKVLLVWETSSEQNNDHFEIQRTLNPQYGFETVSILKGAGTTTSMQKYEFTDVNENTGYTYYRLKQTDIDGTYEFSTIIAIKGAFLPLSVKPFPNPGHSKNIAFKTTGLTMSEQIAVMIYDAQGRVVYSDDNFVMTSDVQVLKLNLPTMSTGKYTITIKGKGQHASASFIVTP